MSALGSSRSSDFPGANEREKAGLGVESVRRKMSLSKVLGQKASVRTTGSAPLRTVLQGDKCLCGQDSGNSMSMISFLNTDPKSLTTLYV